MSMSPTSAGTQRCARWTLIAALALASGCTSEDGDTTPAGTDDNPAAAGGTPRGWMSLGSGPASTFHSVAETDLEPANVRQLAPAWSFPAAGAPTGTAVVVEDRVFISEPGGVHLLNAATGEVSWTNEMAGGTSSPAHANDRLFVLSDDGTLSAHDPEDGRILWDVEIDEHPNSAGYSSPTPTGNLVIVGSSSAEEWSSPSGELTFRGGVVAYDQRNGDEVWRYYTAEPPHTGAAVWSSVSVDEQAGMVFGTSGNNYSGEAGPHSDSIFALDLATGTQLWNRQITMDDVWNFMLPDAAPDFDFATNPVLFEAEIDGERRELVGAGQKSGMFWALDRHTGDVVWSVEVSPGTSYAGGILNNGAYDGEHILVAGNTGTSDAPGSEPANGTSIVPLELEWAAAKETDATTSRLVALDPSDGDVVWERQLPAWVWGPITVANGIGFVPVENELYAFDVNTGETLFTFLAAGTIASGAVVSDSRVFFGSGMVHFPPLGTVDTTFHALQLPQ